MVADELDERVDEMAADAIAAMSVSANSLYSGRTANQPSTLSQSTTPAGSWW